MYVKNVKEAYVEILKDHGYRWDEIHLTASGKAEELNDSSTLAKCNLRDGTFGISKSINK
jgi:hypothetical protein